MVFYKIYQAFLLISIIPAYRVIAAHIAVLCDIVSPSVFISTLVYLVIFANTLMVLFARKEINKRIALIYLAFTPFIIIFTQKTQVLLFGLYTSKSFDPERCCINGSMVRAEGFFPLVLLPILYWFSVIAFITYLSLLLWDFYTKRTKES